MSEKIKTRPKKLRGKGTISVDTQIDRWRKSLKKKGVVLGKNAKLAKKQAEYAREARKVDTEEKLTKKKWF